MADASQLQLNPYALFDPSQWSNPYSNYQNQALPAASYVGMPTNYAGQQIQPQPGMTINQTPQQPAAAPAAASPPPGWVQSSNPYMNNPSAQATGLLMTGNPATPGLNNQMALNILNSGYQGGAQQQAAPAAAPQANSAGLTPQQYMALRANPGPVPTYGATVPQSASSTQPTSGQGGVLQQFLSNWKPASSGAGSGFQQGFAHALKGMGYS